MRLRDLSSRTSKVSVHVVVPILSVHYSSDDIAIVARVIYHLSRGTRMSREDFPPSSKINVKQNARACCLGHQLYCMKKNKKKNFDALEKLGEAKPDFSVVPQGE